MAFLDHLLVCVEKVPDVHRVGRELFCQYERHRAERTSVCVLREERVKEACMEAGRFA